MSEMTRETQMALADDLLAKFEYMVASGPALHRSGSEVYIGDSTKREYVIESIRMPMGMWSDQAYSRYSLTAVTHHYDTASINVDAILAEVSEEEMRAKLEWLRPRDITPTPENYGGW